MIRIDLKIKHLEENIFLYPILIRSEPLVIRDIEYHYHAYYSRTCNGLYQYGRTGPSCSTRSTVDSKCDCRP